MASKPAIERRDFLRLAGLGGVVYASGLGSWGRALAATGQDFSFVQMTDTHWGFEAPAINPEAKSTLKRAVMAVNALQNQPDFVVFTGDLTHNTSDDNERKKRMNEFRGIVSYLAVKDVKFLPGEHDAGLDGGVVYREIFGDPTVSYDHKGVHFVTLDNVSDSTGAIGDSQLQWLHADLARLDKDHPVVVFTHRPLFDLYLPWDWATKDGARALDILAPFRNVTVFYGHIHQQHHHMTGHIAHHSAESLIFPQPAPGSQPKRAPIPWDPEHPYRGLGFRSAESHGGAFNILEKGIS